HHPELINAQMGLPEKALAVPHSLQLTGDLVHYIEIDHLKQLSLEVFGDYIKWKNEPHDNASVYGQLVRLLQTGDHPLISIQEGFGEGHVVVAYDVEGTKNDFYIDVYDPNRPAEESERTDVAGHVQMEQDSRIHVVNGYWYFNMKNSGWWAGQLDSMMLLPYS